MACTGAERNVCKALVEDLVVGKKIEYNKMHLKEIGWEGENCIHLPQNRERW